MSRVKVRQVKFTPEEMAYDAPREVNFKKGLVIQGFDAWKALLSAERGYVRLAPDVRRAFPDDKSVNAALRAMMKPKLGSDTHRSRKSA